MYKHDLIGIYENTSKLYATLVLRKKHAVHLLQFTYWMHEVKLRVESLQ